MSGVRVLAAATRNGRIDESHRPRCPTSKLLVSGSRHLVDEAWTIEPAGRTDERSPADPGPKARHAGEPVGGAGRKRDHREPLQSEVVRQLLDIPGPVDDR